MDTWLIAGLDESFNEPLLIWGSMEEAFLKLEWSQGKVMLTWFFLEVLIGKNEYFPICNKSTVMQVMYYYCFILLDLANNVMIFPLRARILNIESQYS